MLSDPLTTNDEVLGMRLGECANLGATDVVGLRKREAQEGAQGRPAVSSCRNVKYWKVKGDGQEGYGSTCP